MLLSLFPPVFLAAAVFVMQGMKHADFIVEAVVEDEAVKRGIFQQLDKVSAGGIMAAAGLRQQGLFASPLATCCVCETALGLFAFSCSRVCGKLCSRLHL
jgi:hypothetical protein